MKKLFILLFIFMGINVYASSLETLDINNKYIDTNYLNIPYASRNISNIDNIKKVIFEKLKKSKHGYKFDGISKINIYKFNNNYIAFVELFNATKNNKKTNVNFIYTINKNLKIIKTEIDDIEKIKTKYLNEKENNIENDIKEKIVYLKTYKNNEIDKIAFGSFINNDTILTSADFIKESIYNNQEIIVYKDKEIFKIKGVVTLTNDICLLKLDTFNNSYFNISSMKKGKYIQIKNNNNYETLKQEINILNEDDIVFSKQINNNYSYSSLIIDNENNLVGITLNDFNYSNYEAIFNLKLIDNNLNFDSFKPLEEVKKILKINTQNSTKKTESENKILKYLEIGDLKNSIKKDLIRSNVGEIVTLRYKNKNNSSSLNSDLLKFSNNLINDGYKLLASSKIKEIYENNKYKIIILNILNSYTIVISEV